MESVDLYRSLEAEVGSRDGLARGRVAPARVVARADGGDRAAGGLGEDVRAAARARLGRRGAAALPADDDGRRPRRGVPADRRLHRPEPAHVRARRRRAAPRRRDRDRHPRHRRRRPARARDERRDRPGPDRDRDRRQRRRHVRAGDRRARGRERPDRADGARVPHHEADGAAARDADDARPVAARLLQARVGRADHGRLRAPLRAVGARRYSGRLQLAASRRGLAAVRGADGERDRPRAVARARWRS